ncbi:MAG: glycosyltransferase [Candidatus Promineifilaceae bacterium]|nr:glycosyltransferase [Candidatus Promineifilaceae bacterium]
MSHIGVTIIIPSLNSPIIDRVVMAVKNQEGFSESDEILVVGKDEDNLLAHDSTARMIDTDQPIDASSARNLGIDEAAGDLLIFLDSDCLPQQGWLLEHLAAHEAGHEVVGGGVLPEGDNYWHLTYNLTMFHEVFSSTQAGRRQFLPTLNLSVVRYVIEVVGGLDSRLPYSHDVDWTTRMREAGFYPYFWPAAAVRHQHNRQTATQVWHDCAINGQYARQVRLQHSSTLRTPFFLRHRYLTLLLSPFIAAGVTARIYARRWPTMRHHLSLLLAIYWTKLAWCWGAARR